MKFFRPKNQNYPNEPTEKWRHSYKKQLKFTVLNEAKWIYFFITYGPFAIKSVLSTNSLILQSRWIFQWTEYLTYVTLHTITLYKFNLYCTYYIHHYLLIIL